MRTATSANASVSAPRPVPSAPTAHQPVVPRNSSRIRELLRAGGRRQRHHPEAALAELGKRRQPRVGPREGHAQRRAHRRADGLAVERIAARGVEQDAVDAEARPPCGTGRRRCRDCRRLRAPAGAAAPRAPPAAGSAGPADERQAAAVKVVAGDRSSVGSSQPARSPAPTDSSASSASCAARLTRTECTRKRPARSGARRRGGLRRRTGRARESSGIADMAIGIESRIVRRRDPVDHWSVRTTERRLRWLSMTCWPRRLLKNSLDSPGSTGCWTKRMMSKRSCASVLRIS